MDLLRTAQAKGLLSADDTALQELEARFAMDVLDFPSALSTARDALLGAGLAEKALSSIEPLFQPGDVVELCAIGTDGSIVARCEKLDGAEGRTALLDFIKAQFGHRNLYVGICPRKAYMAGTTRKGNADDVAVRRHLVADLDIKDAPDVDPGWTRTVSALGGLNPDLTLHSGNGWQLWLPVQEQQGEALRSTVGPLAEALAALGSDNMADLARIARLPYTLNIPNEGKRQRDAVLRLALPDAPAAQEQEFSA